MGQYIISTTWTFKHREIFKLFRLDKWRGIYKMRKSIYQFCETKKSVQKKGVSTRRTRPNNSLVSSQTPMPSTCQQIRRGLSNKLKIWIYQIELHFNCKSKTWQIKAESRNLPGIPISLETMRSRLLNPMNKEVNSKSNVMYQIKLIVK